MKFWKTEETKEEIPKETEKKEEIPDKFPMFLGILDDFDTKTWGCFQNPEAFTDYCDVRYRIPLELYGIDIDNKKLYRVKIPKKRICYNYE